MKYRLLGRTGLYVSEMCLGTMTFGSEGFWKVMGGLGQEPVNALVGQAFKNLRMPRDQFVVATKATGSMDESPNGRGQSRYHLMNSLDASLKRLQLDHVDLYQLHGFDPLTPLEDTLSTLDDMVRSGKVRYVGLCNLAAWQVMKVLAISDRRGWAPFASVQAYYTLAGRDLERELLPLIRDQQLGLMVWSPLAGGLLSGKFDRDGKGPGGSRRESFDFPPVDKQRAFDCVDAMRPIAARHGASVAQVALAWLLAQPAVSSVIIGAKTMAQLTDNIAATKLALSAEDLATLDEVSQLPAEYPGWMMALQGGYRAKVPERG